MSASTVEGRRYSPFAPDEVHEDLRADPAGTLRALAGQPMVAEAHRGCEVCAELTRDSAPTTSRRGQAVISMPALTTALGLPAGARVTRMWVEDDPHLLHVVVEGEHLDEVPLDAPTPVISA